MKQNYFHLKFILFLLIYSICVLTACSNIAEMNTADYEKDDVSDPAEAEVDNAWVIEEHEVFSLSEGEDWENMKYFGDTEYYVSQILDEESGYRSSYLNRMTEETSECVIIMEVGESIVDYGVDQEGFIYILVRIPGEGENKYELVKIDKNGTEVFRRATPMADENLKNAGIAGAEASEEGFCVITRAGMLLIWDAQGEEAGQFLPEWYDESLNAASYQFGLVQGKDGIYVFHQGVNAISLQGVDIASAVLSDERHIELKLGNSAADGYYSTLGWIRIYSGYDQGFYISDQDALYLYDDQSKEAVELMDWSGPYLDISRECVETIVRLENGEILMAVDNVYGGDVWENFRLVELSGQEARREEIIIGEFLDRYNVKDSELEKCIRGFNASQKKYLVSVKEYDVSELTSFDLDLLQGSAPDLIRLDKLDKSKYEAKGVFEDLTSYFAESEILTKDMLLPSLLNAITSDGSIPYVFPVFTIHILVLQEEYAEQGAVTTEEFLQLATSGRASYLIPETAYDLLQKILLVDKAQYMDWSKGSCTFDDGRFARLLELIHESSLPERAPSTYGQKPEAAGAFYQGIYMARYDKLDSFTDYLIIRDGFEGVAKIAGYPNEMGEIIYPVTSKGAISINSASGHKEAAWEFLEYYMHHYADYSASDLDMSNFHALEKDFERQLHYYENRNDVSFLINPYTGKTLVLQNPNKPAVDFEYDPYTGQAIKPDVVAITEEDYETIRYMVEHAYLIDNVLEKDMNDMLSEEVQSYFKGDKSAKEVAKIIQGKMALYMSEQVW